VSACVICSADLAPDNTSGVCQECKILAASGFYTEEIWLPVVGYAASHEISSRGRVRDRRTGQILTPNTGHTYPRVSLLGRRRYVHHLMAETWLGPRPFGRLVLHGDDDPQNPSITNLSYGCHADNAEDRRRNRGTAP
jgi:hypothetical protein